ncbi:MAG: TIGR04255 family protein [Candidatus Kapabacteria bacterium]|nr:TIGR04255 family protein [Candidatus Kapabacteria bacterium]
MNTEIIKLPKAPLQEVIFEVRWDLDISKETNQLFDSEFDIAVGIMYSNIKKDFKLLKQKLPEGIQFPQEFLNYQTIYQYWTGENLWPVLQLGPGVFTVNETEKNYQWFKHYFPLVKKSLTWLQKAYNKELNYNFASLKYIDKVNVKDYDFKDWLSFIRKNLNINIENKFDTRGKLKQFNFSQVFELDDSSELHLNIINGKNDKQEDILVWETSIIKLVNFNQKNLIKWLENSHTITSKLFKEICKDEFYNHFT